jgi:hypothetical protein
VTGLAPPCRSYAAYNKPEAVIDYMEHVTPEEEWMLVLDSDMLIRKPFTYEQFKAKKGVGVGARYDYMIGEGGGGAPFVFLGGRRAVRCRWCRWCCWRCWRW